MDVKSDTPDARVAQIAASQHGVLTRRQLEDAGLGSKAITIRVRKRQLLRVHQGVYVLGAFPLTHRQRWMAAVLACGEGAVLSHSSAAALWDLLRPIDGPLHVSIPTQQNRRSRRGIRLHRCPSLAHYNQPPLVTRRHNIPVTSIQRTIDDLDGKVAPYLLRRAKRQAELKGIHLEGVERKRQRSDLEEDFLALIHHLTSPETNVKIGRWEVDFLWREQRLVVETDSFTYHQGSIAFEDDYARDLDLRARGYTVLRFTDLQIEAEPDRVVADVARALASPLPSIVIAEVAVVAQEVEDPVAEQYQDERNSEGAGEGRRQRDEQKAQRHPARNP
jgi:very-short-patch-repair endonuclease